MAANLAAHQIGEGVVGPHAQEQQQHHDAAPGIGQGNANHNEPA